MSDPTLRLYMQALIALYVLCLGLLVLLTMADADAGSMAAKALASLRLRRLRMNDMLAVRNIDRGFYLKMTPLADLRRQMSVCRHCQTRQQCDGGLACAGTPGADYSFCPNTPYLDTLMARMRRQARAANHA